MAESLKTEKYEGTQLKKRIITAVAVFGLLGGILYFAYAQTAAQNNVKHFTAFFAVEGETIDQNNDMKKEIARTSGKLNNKGFLAKAPEDVVAKEKEKLAEFEEKMKSFDERLRFLADL